MEVIGVVKNGGSEGVVFEVSMDHVFCKSRTDAKLQLGLEVKKTQLFFSSSNKVYLLKVFNVQYIFSLFAI